MQDRARTLALLLLIVVIAGGTYIRLANLGRSDLRGDEVFHYLVAKSLQRGEGPVLPTGRVYTRGSDISRLVAMTDEVIADRELAARLPSAMFGVVNLVLFAAIAWAIGGPWAAVWAALLLAIYPEAVMLSRRARFYTYQLNFALVALFAGWQAVKWMGSDEIASRRRVMLEWIWMGLAALFFLLGARVQVVTLSVVAGFGVCVAIAGVVNLHRHGWRAWRRNVPLQVTALGLVSLLGILLFLPGLVGRLVATAFSTPGWVQGSGSVLSYYYDLAEAFPLVISLSPVIFLAVWLRNPRLATFLILWFAVPVLAHSLLFPFKGQRFILAATPGLFLAAGIAASMGFKRLLRVVSDEAGRLRSAFIRAAAAPALVAMVAFFVVFTTPAFNWARKVPTEPEDASMRERWSVAADIIEREDSTGAIPLGSLDVHAPFMYFGRVDFHATRVDPKNRGIPHLSTPEAIRAHFGDVGSVLIAVDSTSLVHGGMNRSLYEVLAREGEELCRGECGSLLLYRWDYRQK